MSNSSRPLGLAPAPDRRHVELFPARAGLPTLTPEEVTRRLSLSLWGVKSDLPSWHWLHDQGAVQGSCVGHATAMERAICNIAQRRTAGTKPFNRRYDPIWHWQLAKAEDEWDDTVPGDDNGTSARAAYDVLRDVGPRRCKDTIFGSDGRVIAEKPTAADPADGVSVNRWAATVDEMRTAFAAGIPAIAIGTPWMTGFDDPTDKIHGRYALPEKKKWGSLRGFHETCVYGASDRLQVFLAKNSWGRDYPLHLVPYQVMDDMFAVDGTDAALVTDR